MKKKFVKVMLFCALALTASATFVGCKDYDDDISALQKAIDGITAQGLQSRLDALDTALTAAKADAATAKSDAAAAKTAATNAGNAAETARLAAVKAGNDAEAARLLAVAADAKAAAAAADAISKANDAKVAAIADAKAKVDALRTELQGYVDQKLQGYITQTQLDAKLATLNTSTTAVAAEVSNLFGHRLTSVVRIPNTTLNNEPAILFQNITYVPQTFDGTHTAYTDPTDGIGNGEVTKNATGKGRQYIDNQETVALFQVSPRVGVRETDIEKPYFMCDTQTNYTRAVDKTKAGKDSPVAVANYSLDPVTGVLTVKVRKSVAASENIDFTRTGTTENYYIASLRVPIAAALYTEADKAAVAANPVNRPEVASEYSRIAETTVVPMIKQAGSIAHVPHGVNYDRKELLNGKNADGLYVHYHDSLSLYKSGSGILIDHKIHWNDDVDLKKYVTVCEFEKYIKNPDGTDNITVGNHGELNPDPVTGMSRYKSYGLTFRFALASKAYMQGVNLTDQQEFATINDAINGKMTSRTYTVPGKTPTAVGREPIVRVMLVDTVRNSLVAQRYIKFQWTNVVDIKPLPMYTFKDDTVTCKRHTQLFGTQAMNEDFYRYLNEKIGMSKDVFHSIYKEVKIVKLVKDGGANDLITSIPLTKMELDDTYTPNYGGITVAQADAYAKDAADNSTGADVVFAMARDQNLSNMSYNLKWYMSPKAVGTILRSGAAGASTFIITVEFIDPTGTNAKMTKEFKQTIVLPTQEFAYQKTYWDASAPGKLYNVNPRVYDAQRDRTGNNPLYGTWTGWNTSKDRYNHIGADLVKAYQFKGTSLIPANLDQFIRYIRSCAEVRFEFDNTRFGNYPHLAGYTVTNDRQALWSNTQAALNSSEFNTLVGQGYAHPGTYNDARYDRLAATIYNKFGATATENVKTTNLNWKFNEALGSGVNEASAELLLSEINDSDGSTAARNLINKRIPVSLVVKYNEYNQVPVQDFEVFFVDPLAVTMGEVGRFLDAKVNGSYINVESGLSYTDWNKYLVSRTVLGDPSPNPKGLKGGFSQELWDYYQVRDVVFLTGTAKTNMAWVDNVYTPTEGVTNGNMPSNVVIKQVSTYNQTTGAYTEVPNNPTYLRYFNDEGTPVNVNYDIFMDVQISYKWGLKTSNVKIGVDKAAGTPTNP